MRADGSVVENEFTKWGTPTKTTVIDGNNRYSANNNYDDDRGLVTSTYSTGLDINTRPWYNEYDVDGSLLKTTDPNSNINSMEYDCSGNLIKSENGSEIINYAYQFDGQLLGQEKYRNNTYVEDVVYGYNYLEQLASKNIGSDITLYTYNVMGSITIITYPVDFATVYDYDEAERMTGVEFDGKNISYEYYADGAIKKITYPNSMTTEYSYDNANRVTDIVTKLGGNVLRSYSYTYDGNGNVLTVSGSENAAYTYDSLNRLESSTKNGVTTTYAYDVRNNLISETDGTNTKTYEYGGDNRLHKVIEDGIETVYEYDLNGNLVQRGEDIFAYDEKNRLVYSNVDGVETTYVIGIEGLRKSKTTGDETRNYSYNENGYVLVENEEPVVYGHTALAKKSGTSYYYYLYNAHGDVTAIVDETGNILNSYEYTPWGEISAQTETVENDIKYAGEYYDEETGLIYLRNRYYDPSVRRFTSEDPARDGLNWYAYCDGNPVNYVDPWGLSGQSKVNYIFYTTGEGSDFSRQAQWQKKQLEKNGEEVIMKEVNSSKEFVNAWNSIGKVNGKDVSVNSVYIYSHGHDRGIIFENGSSTNAISIDGKNKAGGTVDGHINDLSLKKMNGLYLMTCNGGHLISYTANGQNLASVISKKVSGGTVYAYDGNISFGTEIIPDKYRKSFAARLSYKQDSFYKIADDIRGYEAKGGWLRPKGLVKYSNGARGPYTVIQNKRGA